MVLNYFSKDPVFSKYIYIYISILLYFRIHAYSKTLQNFCSLYTLFLLLPLYHARRDSNLFLSVDPRPIVTPCGAHPFGHLVPVWSSRVTPIFDRTIGDPGQPDAIAMVILGIDA